MKSKIFSSGHVGAWIAGYAPGARQAPHRDRRSRISVVLRGGYREETTAGAVTMMPGGMMLKSRTVRHEDQFDADGALLFAIEFDDDESLLTPIDAGFWRGRDDAAAIRTGATMLESALAGDAAAVDVACADLIAADPDNAAQPGKAPAWLKRFKQEIETSTLAQVDVAARAREAGVHPAHVSRLFRRCFGVSITGHAQAHSLRRAVELMSQPGAKLSEVALAAGFYDQSHMNRAFRRATGRSPGSHRKLVARAIAAAG